jgi:AAA domain
LPANLVVPSAGDGGTGKSTLLREITARASRGQALFPGQEAPSEGPVSVLYLASEDSTSATLVPGLREAGADLERVSIMDPEADEFPTFPSGLDALRDRILSTGAKLVILDCATDFMDARLNPDKEAEVRAFLRPLRRLAGELHLSIIIAVHINKSTGQTARNRIMGGVAWRNAARHVVMMANPPDAVDASPDRLLVTVKSNLALRGEGYSLRVSPHNGTVPGVDWIGTVSGIDPDRLVSDPPSPEEIGRQEDAISFVQDMLGDGDWHPSADVKRDGLKEGHKRRTIERAADDVGVEVKQEGFPRRTSWRLPQSRQTGMASLASKAPGATGATDSDPDEAGDSGTSEKGNLSSDAIPRDMARLVGDEDLARWVALARASEGCAS